MNLLQRSLIEKAGHDYGFEHVLTTTPEAVVLASARHPIRMHISLLPIGSFLVTLENASSTLQLELQRSFSDLQTGKRGFAAADVSALAAFLRRAASLARALPNQAATDYQQAVIAELATLPTGIINTEVERLVRQRLGQNKFRDAMLAYWGGTCAVTGIAIPEMLRASHAKPWAECISDDERLDVFNGFLLTANLDALFDRFLISFDEQGLILISPVLAGKDLQLLGIVEGMKLRWIDAQHQPYLALHRSRFQQRAT